MIDAELYCHRALATIAESRVINALILRSTYSPGFLQITHASALYDRRRLGELATLQAARHLSFMPIFWSLPAIRHFTSARRSHIDTFQHASIEVGVILPTNTAPRLPVIAEEKNTCRGDKKN